MQIPGISPSRILHSHVLADKLFGERGGIMLHYDDSTEDGWSVEWFFDPACKNGYTYLVLRTGELVQLVDPGFRTPHAGPSLTKNANSFYYGIAAAADGKVLVTDPAIATIVATCVALFKFHGWKADSVNVRIVGHDKQAIWTKDYTADKRLWGKLGRKVDPTGERADHQEILSVAAVREAVAKELTDASLDNGVGDKGAGIP